MSGDQQSLSSAVWEYIEEEFGCTNGEALPQEAEELHVQIMDYIDRKTAVSKQDFAQVMNDIGGAW